MQFYYSHVSAHAHNDGYGRGDFVASSASFCSFPLFLLGCVDLELPSRIIRSVCGNAVITNERILPTIGRCVSHPLMKFAQSRVARLPPHYRPF